MAYSTISKPSLHFNTVLYTGNGANARGITGVGFKPDFVWNKGRDATWQHILTDIVRGATKNLYSDATTAEVTDSTRLQSFNSDGFTIGTNNQINENTDTYVAWNWLAGGSQGSSNTDGSTNTTYTSANTTAGFSISTFTTPGSGTFTVGHGLGVAPKMIIYRPTGSSSWQVGHNSLGWTNFLALNNDGASASNTAFGNTAPTTSVWTGNTANVGANAPCVGYCFAEKKSYSKISSFIGNGNADGTFVYTGFKPAFLLIKISSGTGQWTIFDNKRSSSGGGNEIDKILHPNVTNAENTADDVDFLSNGFKMRNTAANANGSGSTYIYMAFAEEPLVANVGASIPATAR